MQAHKLITWLSIPLMAMMVSVTTGNVPRVPYIIKGCVLSASDQKPVEKVYVSTVVGEEEALTDKNGNFELNTWEKLPVTLQVQHADFVPEKIVLTDVSQKQVFRLKKK